MTDNHDFHGHDEPDMPHVSEPANAVVQRAGQALQSRREQDNAPVAMSPMEMIGRALEMGATPDILKQMMDLRDREEARNAKLAFTKAMSSAKAELRPIMKTRVVDYHPQGKSRVNYRHEDLAGIEEQITPVLTKYGLSYYYESDNGPDRPITVTCVLEHENGYATRTPLTAGADSSGGKNSLQAIASAVTYLQRYTLKLALGLSVSHDDDGKAAGDPEFITEEQAINLRDLIDEVKADEAKFAKFMGVDSLATLPSKAYQAAVNELRAFGKQRA